jgi:hypothetical protein
MKKFTRSDHALLAAWAAACATRVLRYFEAEYPNDDRPRKAIATCRKWAKTGQFKMTDIRRASLSAHTAARKAKGAACFAARAAGQAVATAHVAQHAYGSVYYALKAVAAAPSKNRGEFLNKELAWQSQHLPGRLRREIINRVVIRIDRKGVKVHLRKGKEF